MPSRSHRSAICWANKLLVGVQTAFERSPDCGKGLIVGRAAVFEL